MCISARLLATCAVLPLLAAAPTMAADYDPPIYVEEAPEYVPVEIGSGWYLRGDVSYNIDERFDDDIFGTDPTLIYSDRALPMSATIGVGYHINDFLRAEANFGLLSRYSGDLAYADAVSAVDAQLDNEVWSGMVGAYADLGTISGFTPYVGGGVGLVSARRDYRRHTDFTDPAITDLTFRDRERSFNFAYSLGAGVAYNVTDNLAVDLGYQYFAAPSAEYAEMTGPGTYAVKEGIELHQIKLGLRYDLW